MSRLPPSLVPLALALLLTPAVAAAQWMADPRAQVGLDVSLWYQQYDIDLDVKGRRIDSRHTKLGVSIVENVEPRFRPGLLLGWVSTPDLDRTATAGLSPAGGFIGLSLESYLLDGPRLRLALSGRYVYHSADDSRSDPVAGVDAESLELTWTEGGLGGWAELKLGRVHLLAGAERLWLDGEETVDGDPAVRGRRDYEARGQVGAYAGARFLSGPGSIDVLLHGGARQGIGLQFVGRF